MVLALNRDKDELEREIMRFKSETAEPDGVCFAVGWSHKTLREIDKAMREADENMYADKEAYYNRHPERRR